MTKNMEGPRKVQPGMRSERLRKGEGLGRGAGARSWRTAHAVVWSCGMGYNTGALSTVRFVF